MARDWWLRRKAFDLWSIPHFLFGVLMAFLPPLIGVSEHFALTLAISIAVLWEFGEKAFGIQESLPNILVDLILPVTAFLLTTHFLRLYPSLYPDDLKVFAVAAFALYAFTTLSGWRAYRRRHKDFIH